MPMISRLKAGGLAAALAAVLFATPTEAAKFKATLAQNMSPISGVTIIATSAHLAASAADMTLKLSASAFLALAEPSRSATTMSLTPLSRMLSAWAWPWLP